MCIWKIADSFITYGEKEVGTKIELKYNHETDLPGFAVCRHPNQILNKFDQLGITLKSGFDLELSEIRYLTAFEKAELYQVNTFDIYKRFAFNDSTSVASLVLSSRGQYAGTSSPSLVSKPQNSLDEWYSFWHPLYGMCFSFKPQKSLVELVGEAGLEFVKVNLNFEFAFPQQSEDEVIIIPVDEAATEFSESRLRRRDEETTTISTSIDFPDDKNISLTTEDNQFLGKLTNINLLRIFNILRRKSFFNC